MSVVESLLIIDISLSSERKDVASTFPYLIYTISSHSWLINKHIIPSRTKGIRYLEEFEQLSFSAT